MEYFLGSAITMIAMFITTRLILPRKLNAKVNNFRYSQSHIHTLIMPLIPDIKSYKKKMITQSSKHDERVNIKVVIFDNKAYFVKDGSFYSADMDGNFIDRQTATVVDTIGMDKVQLDKMLFIMDQLRDGKKNDSGDSRNQ
ncbi:MAG: hypothetical protein AN484_01005 [Aphanizomenon flos-aquae WA102]|jgi:hypothetical protein|uniref:Uncharacterized protein n=1 Tax=Aphanizomenon flos-aquae WA102 TaxID=1710896 RepID=A0A1B7X866_APHFL|nr:MAG: hypothetical protein AN484_01005 [Aphanizomenon flos-aquae WA102]